MFQEVLESLRELNETELFYRSYYLAKQDPETLRRFLEELDKEELASKNIWLPDLKMAGSPFISEYFIPNMKSNVKITKHERYTPLFHHSHAFFEMLYILEGSCENTVEGHAISMKQHDICILAPDVDHTIGVFDDDTIVLNVIIRKSTFKETFFEVFTDDTILSLFFSRILYAKNADSYILFRTHGNEPLHAIMELLIMEGIQQEKYSAMAMENLIRAAFCVLLRNHDEAMLSDYSLKHSQESLNIVRYIQNNYQTVTLKSLAEKYNYSPAYIGTLIKKQTGTTFVQILRDVRMKKACALLLTTNLQINEICSLIGYDSVEFFNRTFKKIYQVTPGEYRRKAAELQNIEPHIYQV